ncbi:MAG: 3D domain-containing protein, partial [Acidimicrobiales bacterium]
MAAFGDARYLGAPGAGGHRLVAIAASPKGHGYWALDAHGGVFAYGDVHRSRRAGHPHLPGGAAAIASTPSGHGYWLASKYGDVFSSGDAHFYGSLGKHPPGAPVVGMVPTPDGEGYWLATSSGGVYSFGDARFHGSLGRSRLRSPVIGIATPPGGKGYWLATASGGVFSFGEARFFGALSRLQGRRRLTSIAAARAGRGYWLLSGDGEVHRFGAAGRFGSPMTKAGVEASTIVPSSDGNGYLVGTSVSPPPGPRLTHAPEAGTKQKAEEKQKAEARRASNVASTARTSLGTFLVTCYDLTGITASGAIAGPESVAVDPSVVPLGTHVYIDGVGARTADDTGGAIIGQHLDIWEPTYA